MIGLKVMPDVVNQGLANLVLSCQVCLCDIWPFPCPGLCCLLGRKLCVPSRFSCPRPTPPYGSQGRNTYTETCRHFSQRFARFCLAVRKNVDDCFIRQKANFPTIVVPRVLGLCNPTKICRIVISWISVYVVDHKAISCRQAVESRSHEAVNREGNCLMATQLRGWLQKFSEEEDASILGYLQCDCSLVHPLTVSRGIDVS
jgi:hypothetical protein